MYYFICEGAYFLFYSELNREPVETVHNPGQAVLNALQLVYVAIWDVIEHRITVVCLACSTQVKLLLS